MAESRTALCWLAACCKSSILQHSQSLTPRSFWALTLHTILACASAFLLTVLNLSSASNEVPSCLRYLARLVFGSEVEDPAHGRYPHRSGLVGWRRWLVEPSEPHAALPSCNVM